MKNFLIICLLSLLIIPSITSETGDTPSRKKNRILIREFDYVGSEPLKNPAFLKGFHFTLIKGLAKLPQFDITSEIYQKEAMKDIGLLQKSFSEVNDIDERLSKIFPVDYYCHGTVNISENKIDVIVSISESKTFNNKITFVVEGDIDKQSELQKKILVELAKGLNIETNENDLAIFVAQSTENKEAFSLYSEAVTTFVSDPISSIPSLIAALEKDPNYLDALEDISDALSELGFSKEAFSYMNKLKTLLDERKHSQKVNYANTLCKFGLLYFRLNDLDNALKYCKEEKELKDSLFTIDNLPIAKNQSYANTLINLSTFYLHKNDLVNAVKEIEAAKEIYKSLKLSDSFAFGYVFLNLGAIYKKAGDLGWASSYYKEAKQLYNKLGLTETLAYGIVLTNEGHIHFTKGLIYKEKKNIKMAQTEFKAALEKFNADKKIQDKLRLTNTIDYATTLVNLSNVYNLLGQKKEEKDFAKSAQIIFNRIAKERKDLDRKVKKYIKGKK